jgi:hypothetical protein
VTDDDTLPPHAADMIPIVTGSDGQPYMSCEAAVVLLRAIAETHRELADDPDCDLRTAAEAIDLEADALEAWAIGHTAASA